MDGYIYPCELTDYVEDRIGNVKECEDLIEMVKDAQLNRSYFKKKEDFSCSTCSWRYFCRGGCSIKAKLSGAKKDDLECTINKTLYPIMIESILNNPMMVNKLLNAEIIGE